MQGNWNHGRADYRCRFPKECAPEVLIGCGDWARPERFPDTCSRVWRTAEGTAFRGLPNLRMIESTMLDASQGGKSHADGAHGPARRT